MRDLIYLIVRLWMRLLGIAVGRRTKIRTISLFRRPRGLVKIGSDCIISGRFSFDQSCGRIFIGDRCFIGKSHLISAGSINIEDDVVISWGVTIVDHNSHSMDPNERRRDVIDWAAGKKDWGNVKIDGVRVCRGAWIGFNASILKGVTVGENAIVGANAVVTKDVPVGAVVAGNPAKIIKSMEPNDD